MNWYRVTKTIRGRKYDYWQKTYRVGRSVKTLNKYIGPSYQQRYFDMLKRNGETPLENTNRILRNETRGSDLIYNPAIDDAKPPANPTIEKVYVPEYKVHYNTTHKDFFVVINGTTHRFDNEIAATNFAENKENELHDGVLKRTYPTCMWCRKPNDRPEVDKVCTSCAEQIAF
jgi:hypothetical protein